MIASPKSNGTSDGSNGKTSILGLGLAKAYRPHDNKVTSKQPEALPRKAWEQQSDELV